MKFSWKHPRPSVSLFFLISFYLYTLLTVAHLTEIAFPSNCSSTLFLLYYQGLNNIIHIDFDYKKEFIYWVDSTRPSGRKINRMRLNGSDLKVPQDLVAVTACHMVPCAILSKIHCLYFSCFLSSVYYSPFLFRCSLFWGGGYLNYEDAFHHLFIFWWWIIYCTWVCMLLKWLIITAQLMMCVLYFFHISQQAVSLTPVITIELFPVALRWM